MPDARMPVLYLSHGAPPLADDRLWTAQLSQWSTRLPRPASLLMVSAHWELAPVSVSATRTVPLVHDFWGFPECYYRVTYPAPGAPDLAAAVTGLLAAPGEQVHAQPDRGLDHGAYVPLVQMYAEADIPTLQLSMPSLEPRRLFELGQRLAPLRDAGVLIVGSGFTTHNLREMSPAEDGPAPTWSSEFDEWVADAVDRLDVDALLDFEERAPAARLAHPRTEHFAPLFVSLGAALGVDSEAERASVIDGFWHGLSKRSWQLQ